MKEQVNTKNILYYISLAFIFLLSLHFMGYIEKRVIVAGSILCLIWIAAGKKIIIDIQTGLVIAIMLLYGIIFKIQYSENAYWSGWSFINMALPPVVFYFLSRQMSYKQKEEKIEWYLIAVCLGGFFYSCLNYTMYVKYGFHSGNRIWDEFWTHTARYATEYSYWGVFIAGLLGYGVTCIKEKKWFRGLTILVFIVIDNYINIMVDNRMVLMVTVVVIAVNILMYVIFHTKEWKKWGLLLIGVAILAAIGCIAVMGNVGGVRDTTFYRHFFTRNGGILKNIRFRMIWETIPQLPAHWKGGGTIVAAGYSAIHNYWLQAANDTGIFPFILWMIFNVQVVIDLVKCVVSKKISQRMKYLIVPLMVAIVSYLSMEIGGQGKSEYILFYVMVAAFLRQLVLNQRITEGL